MHVLMNPLTKQKNCLPSWLIFDFQFESTNQRGLSPPEEVPSLFLYLKPIFVSTQKKLKFLRFDCVFSSCASPMPVDLVQIYGIIFGFGFVYLWVTRFSLADNMCTV